MKFRAIILALVLSNSNYSYAIKEYQANVQTISVSNRYWTIRGDKPPFVCPPGSPYQCPLRYQDSQQGIDCHQEGNTLVIKFHYRSSISSCNMLRYNSGFGIYSEAMDSSTGAGKGQLLQWRGDNNTRGDRWTGDGYYMYYRIGMDGNFTILSSGQTITNIKLIGHSDNLIAEPYPERTIPDKPTQGKTEVYAEWKNEVTLTSEAPSAVIGKINDLSVGGGLEVTAEAPSKAGLEIRWCDGESWSPLNGSSKSSVGSARCNVSVRATPGPDTRGAYPVRFNMTYKY